MGNPFEEIKSVERSQERMDGAEVKVYAEGVLAEAGENIRKIQEELHQITKVPQEEQDSDKILALRDALRIANDEFKALEEELEFMNEAGDEFGVEFTKKKEDKN